MKILVVGTFGSPQRDEAIARGFRECGAEVSECGYGDLIYSRRLFTRIQFRCSFGPVCFQLAARVRKAAQHFRPDVILFRRPLEFTPGMLRYIGDGCDAILVSFNNDDPFSPSYTDRRWRNLRAAIPLFDAHFAFRRRNIEQYMEYGARAVALWEPFYSPWLHRPLVEDNAWVAHGKELLFAMHAERDERRDAVLELIKADIPLRVYSWNWHKLFGKKEASALNVLQPIWGDEYVRAIGNAMGTLCFFSKQNNDELTSRVFEIPACGGLLIAERNERIEKLFRDGEEAVLFSDVPELINRVKALRNNPDLVARIRRQGRQRLYSSRHSIADRCADAIDFLKDIRSVRKSSMSEQGKLTHSTWSRG